MLVIQILKAVVLGLMQNCVSFNLFYLIMAALWTKAGHYIFILWFLSVVKDLRQHLRLT